MPIKTNRNRRLMAYEHEQLRLFEAGVAAANPGMQATSAPAAEMDDAPATVSVIPNRRRGARHAEDFEQFDDEPLSYTPALPGQELDRIYTFTSTGSGKRTRVEASTVPRGFVAERRVSGDDDDWQSLSGDNHTWEGAPDHDDPDWEDFVEDRSPATALDSDGEDVDGEDVDDTPSTAAPKKRYTSSDDPMANWLPLRDQFLQETVRREAVGQLAACASCRVALQTTWPPELQDSTSATVDALIRCETCGDFSECVACCLLRHARTPLHVVKRFSRKGFWERTTLTDLGVTVHIGHQGGLCPYPGPPKSITVMHTTGIHRLRASFCNCDVSDTASPWQLALRDGWFPATTIQPQTFATVEVLKLFRLLNVISHVNVRNFVTALERKSNPHGTEWVPDRYKSFALMTRQWSYLQRLRRSGMGHTADGVSGAKWGSTAVRCWACPWEGVNLPEDWKNASPEERFLFMLFLALDANFRMRSRLRKKSAKKKYHQETVCEPEAA
ncbi:hypothetical protein BDZ89DRAFT_1138475 [Hymenopellis radicata]|nr:hypothetical protein BDZ89DRAFT_1138475 [Hymenopellis radicata]